MHSKISVTEVAIILRFIHNRVTVKTVGMLLYCSRDVTEGKKHGKCTLQANRYTLVGNGINTSHTLGTRWTFGWKVGMCSHTLLNSCENVTHSVNATINCFLDVGYTFRTSWWMSYGTHFRFGACWWFSPQYSHSFASHGWKWLLH